MPVSSATQTALNLKANLANPTFTGTLVAPTVNATTALQENGVDIDSKFAPIVNPTFSGAVVSNFVAFRAFFRWYAL